MSGPMNTNYKALEWIAPVSSSVHAQMMQIFFALLELEIASLQGRRVQQAMLSSYLRLARASESRASQ